MPRLGEPRWLLFPPFLFAALRPAVSLHLVHDVEGLTRLMMAYTVVAAAIYLCSVRACLVALGIPASRRAAALGVAGFSAGLFFASMDLMEPIFGATVIALGLAVAATRAARPGATATDQRTALLIAVAGVAMAALLYQGLILGLGLVPLVIPNTTLRDRRAWLASALILAIVPLVIVGVLMINGNSPGHALFRALRGEENPLYQTYLKRPGLMAYVVALVAGPPQGLVTLPDFHGFNGVLAALGIAGSRGSTIVLLFRLGAGVVLVGAGVLHALRRRDSKLLIAFGLLLLLPLVLGISNMATSNSTCCWPSSPPSPRRAPTAVAASIGALLLLLNGGMRPGGAIGRAPALPRAPGNLRNGGRS